VPEIKLGDKTVTEDSAPYVIAEIGHNHMGSVEVCKSLIYEATMKIKIHMAKPMAFTERPLSLMERNTTSLLNMLKGSE